MYVYSFNLFTGVQLFHSIVLVSAAQRSECHMYTCMYSLPSGFPSHPGNHRASGRVACAIRQALLVQLLFIFYLLSNCSHLCAKYVREDMFRGLFLLLPFPSTPLQATFFFFLHFLAHSLLFLTIINILIYCYFFPTFLR